MLPPLASVQMFAARIPGGVDTADYARAGAVLQDASSLVRAEAGTDWVDDDDALLDTVPDVVVTVTIAAARRAFANPDMIASESIQDYSATFASSSADVYLTKAERNAVRRAVGRSGLWTLATTRTDVAGDVPSVTGEAWATSPREDYDPLSEGWGG